ncbi:uncharacterized protein LOC130673678 isoform X1 [Microplitis mediator]|uniref:uncharacterized protein LOC130673678 isoform X1 n=2 Tax=Microplitis mediator TaxID=375433 RepID=UPI0025549DEE|nr:uncharacterized protein LOC130673678 isoform X1 [Microplitis mediator]XP_057334784.1 uncharacterized protein LOC130673678 isoform X1 [Microplitis mediator]XP_057334785.1 uncharacterized protein LOC130673678 isoform X1 [Microplitis mediator]XP_057334786.1 uncharacterized protein LOC130673678 isoform X1 [Microplitis mediator]
MTHHFDSDGISIGIFLLIIQISISLVSSQLVVIQKGDPKNWGKGSFTYFNRIYAFATMENSLHHDGYCTGDCSSFDDNFRYGETDLCRGIVHKCWVHLESQERRKAVEDFVDTINDRGKWKGYSNRSEIIADLEYKLDHTGNVCACLCERNSSASYNFRGKLLDSICYDPISVDLGYVATGVRFKRYENRIHLELRQGILANGRINPSTVRWKKTSKCNNAKPVVYNFRGTLYKGLKFVLQDMILPYKAVVTGVTIGRSIRGRFVTKNGDIKDSRFRIHKPSQCRGRNQNVVPKYRRLLPPVAHLGNNVERSKSCKHHVSFGGTSDDSDFIQHIVPYIDLQEIVTDPPEPIRGIGWYYRGCPESGGFLALRIWK